MDWLESKFAGSLVGAAVGDAVGAGGKRYTDDTAMMIGLAESLIENRGFDADHMMQTFVENYDAEPWRGYGPGPPRIFRMIQSGLSWQAAAENVYPGGSYGNGSAMRVAPVGLFCYDNPSRLRELAYQSSRLTHTHVLGMEGAALQAYAVALAVRADSERFDRADFLNNLSEFVKADVYGQKLQSMQTLLKSASDRWNVVQELGNTVEAFNSVPVAVFSFLANSGFANTLEYALSLGGDRDTISAMTGAIAGACYGIEAIPMEWTDGLENRDFIEALAKRLWQIKTNQ